jgi:magnesium transporter
MQATQLLSHAFLLAHPEDAARVMERLPAKEQARLFANTSAGTAKVMEHMVPSMGASCLVLMKAESAARIFQRLSLDFKLAVLRCMQHDDRDRLLAALPTDESEPLRRLLHYPDGSAGALMDPYLLTVPDDITAGEALRRMRASAQPVLYYLYVLDRGRQLVGVATLRELMRARPSDALSSVMRREVARLPATLRSDDIVKNPRWRDFHALPVVDEQGCFLGAIRHETLRRVEREVAQTSQEGGAIDTLLALSELYWLGLAGMMPGAATETVDKPEIGEQPEHKYHGE